MSKRAHPVFAAASVLPLAIGLAAASASSPSNTNSSPAAKEVNTASSLELGAGPAVLLRHAVLWSSWRADAKRLGTLETGDVVQVLNSHRMGYWHVQTREETAGWVTERSLRAIDPGDVSVPASGPATGPPPSGVSSTTLPHVTADLFNGCPAAGDPNPKGSQYQQFLAWNREKNRATTPTDAEIDSTVTLARMLQPGDDENRFDVNRAAEITGYVYDVKSGGATETVNCRLSGATNVDTHIELTLGPSDVAPNRRVIIEITPRWRAAELNVGVDWSTSTLEHAVEGRWVRVRGWLFFDGQHQSQAENTRPGGASNWRATAWEIHPVTELTVVPNPGISE